jgi:SAM-dependent methyltransferase
MRPTERFSTRVADYARYRPSYPAAAIEVLAARCGLGAGAMVAEIGSGTGILTARLLASGAEVYAVEPNDGMREAAEAHLAGQPRFHSVNGSAEATTLPADSVDLWVAGQAFHWFDGLKARAEALRIVRGGGFGAMLWNERPAQPDAFLADYERLLEQYSAEYTQIKARRADEPSMRAFFGGAMELASFPNEQRLDYEGLRGRLMSSSYTPEAGDAQYPPMLAALRALFDRHATHGEVVFGYRTLVYFAPLGPRSA